MGWKERNEKKKLTTLLAFFKKKSTKKHKPIRKKKEISTCKCEGQVWRPLPLTPERDFSLILYLLSTQLATINIIGEK